MQTLEHLLVLVTLLGLLGIFLRPFETLNRGIQNDITQEERTGIDLACSQRAERTGTYFTHAPAGECWIYPYTYRAHPPAFTLILEGEGHYE